MSSIETFESTLKDVVNAKRLSASKMSTLTDIALKCMKNDTQLVSTLFRTHRTLSPAAKVNSLYVFDALSRAARNQVNKHRIAPPSDPSQGNCATFIVKVEGILDSLWQDLLSTRDETLKEKSKKILDIWVKNNTFPSAALDRLSQLLKNSEQEYNGTTAPAAIDPRSASQPIAVTPITPPQPPSAATDTGAVANLINLLAKATNANAATNPLSQTPTNTATIPVNPLASTPAPGLAADPLAIIQQLAQAAGLANGVPAQPVPLPVSLVPSSSSATSAVPVLPPAPDRAPLQPPPYRNDHFDPGRRESTHDTYVGPDRGTDRDDYYDERHDYNPRGGSRGGPRGGFRGRGRGRRDDRDRYGDRARDRDWAPPRRGRRSRSRSPPGRYGGRRDRPPYSPPRRPPPHGRYADAREGGDSRAPEAGKDEFGRDIRPASPDNNTPPPGTIRQSSADTHSPPSTRPTTHSPVEPHPPHSDTQLPRRDGRSLAPPPPQRAPPAAAGTQGGLETFDPTTFDPTLPNSWTTLGNAWQVTHGYLPSQEELMAYVMGGFGAFPNANQYMGGDGGQWAGQGAPYGGSGAYPQGGAWQDNGGERDGGVRGSDSAYGNGRNVAYGEEQAHERDMPQDGAFQGGSADSEGPGGDGRSGAGKMQKVGDRWVFVRAAAPA